MWVLVVIGKWEGKPVVDWAGGRGSLNTGGRGRVEGARGGTRDNCLPGLGRAAGGLARYLGELGGGPLPYAKRTCRYNLRRPSLDSISPYPKYLGSQCLQCLATSLRYLQVGPVAPNLGPCHAMPCLAQPSQETAGPAAAAARRGLIHARLVLLESRHKGCWETESPSNTRTGSMSIAWLAWPTRPARPGVGEGMPSHPIHPPTDPPTRRSTSDA